MVSSAWRLHSTSKAYSACAIRDSTVRNGPAPGATAKLRRAPRPVDRRAGQGRRAGRARHQEAQARSRALFLRRPARRAARQDAAGVGSGERHARRRQHDHDAARQGHRAQDGVPGVHAGRRLRHAGDGGRRRFRHDRRSRRPSACCPGPTRPAGCCATSISATASRCRSPPARVCARRLRSLGKAGFDFLAGLEVEFHLFKLENAQACRPPTPPGRRRRRR